MKNVSKIAVLTVALAALSGCATNGSAPMLGSHAADQSVMGCATGSLAAYATSAIFKGSQVGRRNAAIAGCAGGGILGYQHGKALDLQRALQAQQINQSNGFQTYFYDAQRQPVSQQVVQQIAQNPQAPQVAQTAPVQSMEVPIGFREMFDARRGLTDAAVRTLRNMNQMAVQSNSQMYVLIPDTKMGYASQIRAAAPAATINKDINAQNNFVTIVVVKPTQQ